MNWVDREGISTPLREERLPYGNPRFSPDGRHLLLQIRDEATNHIWVQDLERATLTPLTFEGAFNGLPIWSPDGKRVTFSSAGRDQSQSLYERSADGSGEVERLLDKEQRQLPDSWSPDGVLAFHEFQLGTGSDIWVLEDGVPQAFIATDAREMSPMFSPDGQWMAYESDKSGQSEVYLTPYPGPRGEQQVSTDGGRMPCWSPDGRELFYRAGAGQVMSVSVQTGPSVELGTPQLLFEVANMVPNSGFDVPPGRGTIRRRHKRRQRLQHLPNQHRPQLVRGTHAPRAGPVASRNPVPKDPKPGDLPSVLLAVNDLHYL